MAARPDLPTAARCKELLSDLAGLVARDGAARLLGVPVSPGPAAFPEPLGPANTRPESITPGAVQRVLRRLAWHAGLDRTITLHDERLGAPPTARRPETSVEVAAITRKDAALTLHLVGEDDVIGTLAHEIGVAHAAIVRSDPDDPYRAAEPLEIVLDPDRDLARGSHATIYLGLGVLAANAAFQQYSRAGRFNGAYSPLEYDVLRAGYVPMSELAYLLAVQALVREPHLATPAAPAGLGGPQRDEVTAWIAELCEEGDELRARLGIAPDARGEPRPAVEVFAPDASEPRRAHHAQVATAFGGTAIAVASASSRGWCSAARPRWRHCAIRARSSSRAPE